MMDVKVKMIEDEGDWRFFFFYSATSFIGIKRHSLKERHDSLLYFEDSKHNSDESDLSLVVAQRNRAEIFHTFI